MATNFIQDGDVVQYTNGGSTTITSGSVVVMGDIVGIALVDIAAGDTGSVKITGVWKVTKASGVAWNQGDQLDWDASAGNFSKGITAAAGDVTKCGVAFKAAASTDTVGYILLTPGTGTGV